MALNAKKIPAAGGGNRTKQAPLDPGTYPARVVQILDLGLQNQREFQGKEKAPAYELNITYELLDEFMKDEDGKDQLDKPRWISERIAVYNLKQDKAKSTKRYYALDPKEEFGGDFGQLVNIPCMVTITQTPKGDVVYNNVSAVTGMRERDAAKAEGLKNPARIFDLSEPDLEVFNGLPEYLQDIIKGNLEFAGSPLDKLLNGGAAAPAKAPRDEPAKDNDKEGDDW